VTERTPAQLAHDIVETARAFVHMTDGQANIAGRGSLCHLFDCVGGLSQTTCTCGWTDLVWAVRRMDRANEDSELQSLLDDLQAHSHSPDELRTRLHARGWRRDHP
jgi:hypothetical protein